MSATVRPSGGQAEAHAPETLHPCQDRHKMRPAGYLRGPAPAGMDCRKPLRVVCRRCGFRSAWACSGHRASRCAPCALRYQRRVRVLAHSGMGRRRGHLYLLTLTAPGRARHCTRGDGCEWKRRGEDCQHEDACRCTPAGGVDLGHWNMGHSACWNRFRTRLKAHYEGLQFFRGVEVQDGKRGGASRGALHHHAMVWSPYPLSKRELREWAIDAGYGHSVDLAPCDPGSRKASYYVSKYVTKACDSRQQVPWYDVNRDTGEITPCDGRYRTWSMSRDWGLTMAAVRADAAAYARSKASDIEGDAVALLGRVLGAVDLRSGIPPPSPA